MNSDETNPAPPPSVALFTLLETVDNGEALLEAEEMLREIVSESHARGGKGVMTLTFKLETSIARGSPKTEVRIEVNGKPPKIPAGASTFFATADGALRRDDPAQMELAQDMGKTIRITSKRGAKGEPEKREDRRAES